MAPCDQAVTEGQDAVVSATVAGQPKPMVYWEVLWSSAISADTGEMLPQPKVTSRAPTLNHCDSYFTLTSVEGQSPSDDDGPVCLAADR